MQYWLALTAGVIAGVLLEAYLAGGLYLLLSVSAIALGLFFYAIIERSNEALLIGLACIAAAFVIWRIGIIGEVHSPTYDVHVGKGIEVMGQVIREPEVRDRGVSVVVRLDRVEASSSTRSFFAKIQLPAYTQIEYGDVVRVKGTFDHPKPFDTGARIFAYDDYMQKEGIGYVISFGDVLERKQFDGHDAYAIAFAIKRWCSNGINAALSEPEAGLARGMLLGDKRALPSSLYDQFVATGLVHIIVLSGFNITIVASALAYLMRGVDRRYKFGAVILVGIFFVIITGFAAASVRAAIMATIITFAEATKRIYDALRALCIAVCAMLLWNPLMLLHDAGFQLSILATLGLILGATALEERFTRLPQYFREIVSATLAAYLATLPFILYVMGTFSLVAIPANLFVLPFVGVAMLFSFVALVAGIVTSAAAPLFGFPAQVLLGGIITVVEISARLPFAQFLVPSFPFALFLLMYGALLLIMAVSKQKTAP